MITAKVDICVVGCDMVERVKLMGALGYTSISYCEYCTIRGLKATGLRCPHVTPEGASGDTV